MDNTGNRTVRTPQPLGTASNYTYDAIYELTNVKQGANATESYSYDPVGNRLSSLGVAPYQYNTSNELIQRPNTLYAYDANGNTTIKTDLLGKRKSGLSLTVDRSSRATDDGRGE